MTATEARPEADIRADLNAWFNGEPCKTIEEKLALDLVGDQLLDDIEPLLSRLAAVERERDELRAENEQLRDALADRDQELARVEARTEAVEALCEIPDWPPQGVDINGRAMPKHVSTEDILAALSVAPQPQLDVDNTRVPVTEYQRQPQPAPKHEGLSSFGYPYCGLCRKDWPCPDARKAARS
jgi:hypothetical protein